ncbi:hypothetical protein LPJ66_004286 [Kickxella alabastrina]|uniref:Uncharacterized protein n=1 Tax=Kickxella alabastrina TaxID=61397 RepID=A0ACC1ILQ7_9FUNG|nr:hypothetical protein LPJ66_004286 [Kickxella alabastrina]
MDICTEVGRSEIIKLFINLSFSEDHWLGFDPSIKHLHDLDCWEITVPGTAATDSADSTDSSGDNDGSYGSTGPTFYSSHILIEASHLFGRLTRCFLATDKKPTRDSRIRSKDCTVFIKDAWTEVADGSGDNDVHYKVAHLRKITRTLERYPELAGTYPVLEAGGRVEFQSCSDNTFAKDTMRSVLGDLFDDVRVGEKIRKLPLCAHKRIATSPIGIPLDELRSVPELIIAVADAMRARHVIAEHCHILHRDISTGNFLFRRMEDGTVNGMLIDFDHAIDCEDPDTMPQKEQIGTLPFMSVNNLEKSSNTRTVLDDYEALIYVLAWLGTFGFSTETRRAKEVDYWGEEINPLICEWHMPGPYISIAKWKRMYLDSSDSFSNIVHCLNPDIEGIELLQCLLHDLRTALVDNAEFGPEFVGTRVRRVYDDTNDNLSVPVSRSGLAKSFARHILLLKNRTYQRIDPIEKRAEKASEISKKFIDILDKYADGYREILDDQSRTGGSSEASEQSDDV